MLPISKRMLSAFALKAVFYNEADFILPGFMNGTEHPTLTTNPLTGMVILITRRLFRFGENWIGGALIVYASGWKIPH